MDRMDRNFKIPPGIKYLIGIDEVGRGPLAGPLTICAVSVDRHSKYNKKLLQDFRDSKKLSPKKRLELSHVAEKAQKNGQIKYSLHSVSSTFVDKYGLSNAVKGAIKKALKKLNLPPKECFVFLDGLLYAPAEYIFQKTIIKGDEKVKIISCASVIAKVHRDELMVKMDKKYPGYDFSKHKGYGTRAHFLKIRKLGPCEIHRQSFLKKFFSKPNKSKV